MEPQTAAVEVIELASEDEEDETGQDSAASSTHGGGKANPFAAFSYRGIEEGDDGPLPVPLMTARRIESSVSKARVGQPKKEPPSKRQRRECASPENFNALPRAEQEQIFHKWHNVTLPARRQARGAMTTELYRFQLLVAVLLSSHCQQSMVRQAVEKLSGSEAGLTPEFIVSLDAEELHPQISFVHYNKTKARHMVKAAQQILQRGGRVPTQEKGLLELCGIGSTLAPLLAFLYRYQEEHQHEFPIGSVGDIQAAQHMKPAQDIERSQE